LGIIRVFLFDFIEFAAEFTARAELFKMVHRNKKNRFTAGKPVEQNMKVQQLQQGESGVKAKKPGPG
ncbi:MAG: hypothetical protein QMB70_00240, partial [Aeromonadaceae bacterium]